MPVRNPAGYGKPEPRAADAALRLGAGAVHAVEAFKYLLLILPGDPNAVIGELNDGQIPLTTGGNRDMASDRRLFHAVLKENTQHLLDGNSIRKDFRRIVLQQLHLMLRRHKRDFLGNIADEL